MTDALNVSVIKYSLIGLVLGLLFFVIQIGSKTLHEEWIKRESAYPVEKEYLYFNAIGRVRGFFNSDGYLYNSTLEEYLYKKQKSFMKRAFEKIPLEDGERIVWQLNIDQNFWNQIKSKNNVPAVMTKALHYFDRLMSAKIASKWANLEAFVRINQLAAYFFNNHRRAGLSSEEQKYWRDHIIIALDNWADSLDPAILRQYPLDSVKALPLSWNNLLLTSSGEQVIDFTTNKIISCKSTYLKALFKASHRIENITAEYHFSALSSYERQWLADTEKRNKNFSIIAPAIITKCKFEER